VSWFLLSADLRTGQAVRQVGETSDGEAARDHGGEQAPAPLTTAHGVGRGEQAVVISGDLLPRDGARPLAREDVAHAVASREDATLAGLHGGYAIAAWDAGARTLTLLRDGLGRWPLYHAVSTTEPWLVVAGTSATAVARASGRLGDLEPVALDEYWTEGFIRPTRSAFRGVHPVLPGERLRITWPPGPEATRGEPGAARPAIASDRLVPRDGARCEDDDPAAVRATLRGLFEEATRRLLHDADVQRPLLTLSGGIDSTLVAELTARRLPQIRALTLGALIPLTQDEPWARLAARRTGITLDTVRPYLRPLAPLIARCVGRPDQPLWAKLLAMYHALAERHGEARVVITGDCADGVFLGGTDDVKWTRLSASQAIPCVPFGPPLPAWLGPLGRDQASNHAVGHLLARQYHGTRTLGVLARTPFIDWDVMSYARSLPKHVLLQPGKTKAVLQEQLAGWPEPFLNRPKMGFPFRMRWATLARGELGAVAAQVSQAGVARFADRLPRSLGPDPARWGMADIFHNFDDILRLVGWSAFARGLEG
jgi:asparagine synthetase B (glutamine-hydrolysing)